LESGVPFDRREQGQDETRSRTERSLATTGDNIEHIGSQSLYGIAVVKMFLQSTANIQQGTAQPQFVRTVVHSPDRKRDIISAFPDGVRENLGFSFGNCNKGTTDGLSGSPPNWAGRF